MGERCRTCRYWDVHSVAALKGDCRAPGDHRYSRVRMEGVDYRTGRRYPIVALLDSFGPEETGPHYRCGVWEQAEQEWTGLVVHGPRVMCGDDIGYPLPTPKP